MSPLQADSRPLSWMAGSFLQAAPMDATPLLLLFRQEVTASGLGPWVDEKSLCEAVGHHLSPPHSLTHT